MGRAKQRKPGTGGRASRQRQPQTAPPRPTGPDLTRLSTHGHDPSDPGQQEGEGQVDVAALAFGQSIQVRQVLEEQQRQEVDRYLRSLIAEPAQVVMAPALEEQRSDLSSLVLGVYDQQRLVGGLWASDPYTEFLTGPGMATWPAPIRIWMITRFTMLHHVALDADYRRKGLGQRMIAALMVYAKARGKAAVYGVADPESVGFYRATGFEVADHEEAAFLSAGPTRNLQFPIVGTHRWFARNLGDQFRSDRVYFAPPRPLPG